MKPFPWRAIRQTTGMTDWDYLQKHYAHTGNAQLSRIMGRAITSIWRQACKMGLHKAVHKRDLTAELIQLSKSKESFHLMEIKGAKMESTWRAAEKLRKRGKLFKVLRSRKDVVYCKDIIVARRIQSEVDATAKPAGVTIKHHGRAWWDKDAPMLVTEHTKYTIAERKIPALLRTNTHGEIG
jgi:hypothetical protein